jgi:hypothetical protein
MDVKPWRIAAQESEEELLELGLLAEERMDSTLSTNADGFARKATATTSITMEKMIVSTEPKPIPADAAAAGAVTAGAATADGSPNIGPTGGSFMRKFAGWIRVGGVLGPYLGCFGFG